MSFIETKFHQKVKMRLLMEGSVFMSSVLFSLKISWSDSIHTAGTDGKNLLINRKWYESLSVEQAMGLLYHESFHVAYQHPLIGKNLQRRRHNMACISADNYVMMANGSQKKILDILPGEYVASPLGPNKVLGIAYNGKREVGVLNNRLICTPDHRILTDEGFDRQASSFTSTAKRELYLHTKARNEADHLRQLPSHELVRTNHTNRYKIWSDIRIPFKKGTISRQICGKKEEHTTSIKSIWKRSKLHGWTYRWGRNNNSFYQKTSYKNQLQSNVLPDELNNYEYFVFPTEAFGDTWILWGSKSKQLWSSILVNTAKWFCFGRFFNKDRAFAHNKKTSMQSCNRILSRAHAAKERRPTDTTYAQACRRDTSFEHTAGFFQEGTDDIRKVYDLITEKGAYIAEGIVVHNCDYMINLQLVQDGFELPPGGLLDHQYANMSSMQIYELLDDDDDESDGGGGYDCDILEPEEGTDPEVAQAEIENILLRAAKLSKEANDKPGSIPGELQRLIDSLLSPVLPWNVILHNYMDAYAKDDYSWARPNRRYTEEYLPSMFSEAIENISVLIDASGSVSGEELSQFFTEIISIKENMNPQSFLIGSFDTRLYEAKEFTTLNSYSVEGGGGTSAYPIKKFIEEKKPNVLIVFTDMEMSFAPLEGLDFKDIFWINTGAKGVAAPMGRIIDYEN